MSMAHNMIDRATFMALAAPTLSVIVYGSPAVFCLGSGAKLILRLGNLFYQKVDLARERGVGLVLRLVGGVV